MSYEPGDFRDLEVRIHRAAAIGDHHVPTFAIVTDAEWPDSRNVSLDDLARRFDAEAAQIAGALIGSLPGGTLDRLIGLLLEYKASHFVVNYDTKNVPANAERAS